MTPDKSGVLYGTLGLMIIPGGPGCTDYRIARRIEQIAGISSHSTRALCIRRCSSWADGMDFVQMGHIRERPPRAHLRADTRRAQAAPEGEVQWQRAASIVEGFLKISENPS